MRSDTDIREDQIRAALRSWVLSKARDLDSDTLTDTTPLFEERHLNSLHLLELLVFIERLLGEPIDVDGLRPGDFRDIDTVVARLRTGLRTGRVSP
jgi:acyl carrier protein